MKRFHNILAVPLNLEANDPVIARGLRLAETTGAKLTIAWPIDTGGLRAEELLQEVAEAAKEELARLIASLPAGSVAPSHQVLIGQPFMEIIRAVLQNGYDLVMKTARGMNLPKALFFGTTALHLLRKCPVPVWILKPTTSVTPGNVLAAIDLDATEDFDEALNRRVLELAASLATLDKVELHVVHSWSVPFEDMVRHSPWLRVRRTRADDYIDEIEARHRRQFEQLLAGAQHLCPPNTYVHFVKGRPEEVIVEYAHQHNVEVIVMATLARAGVPGLLIGNVAEAILHEIDFSALTIKPEGFVSPVTL